MNQELRVGVCSRSFASSELLRKSLEKYFSKVEYNYSTDSLSGLELEKFLCNKEIAVIGLEKITHELLENCPALTVLCKMGTGIDKIDLVSLKKKGIQFFNTPGFNKFAVAELVCSQVLVLLRRIIENNERVKRCV